MRADVASALFGDGPPSAASAPRGKASQAEALVALADAAEFFRAPDGDSAYATIPVDDHRETWPVRAKGFRRWLVSRFYATHGKPPSAQALTDVLGLLEARAQFGGAVHPVAVRVAAASDTIYDTIYVDLRDERWRAVEIGPAGWRVIAEPPVRFRRPRGMLPLPVPVPGGTLAELRPFVNVADDEAWALLAAWLVAAVRPAGPYPILVLGGEHGSAKSTTAEVLRRLADPNVAALRAEPADVRDVMIAASNGWVVALDNLSSLPAWLSDALCRLATGGGLGTRELYSDMEETLFAAQRPVILNGIETIVTRADLLDRALLLDCPPITETRRRPAADFWFDFEAARPRLLGALLDAVSLALRRSPEVALPRLPRMADFAIWATAAEPAIGVAPSAFLDAYTGNRTAAHELALDASLVAPLVRALADAGEWTGTAAELLARLTEMADDAARRSRAWPASPRALAGALRRLAPNLRAVGVGVGFEREATATRRRLVTIQKDGGNDRPDRPDCRDARADAGFRVDGAPGGLDGSPSRRSSVDGGRPRPSTANPAKDGALDDMDGVDGHAAVLSGRDQEDVAEWMQ